MSLPTRAERLREIRGTLSLQDFADKIHRGKRTVAIYERKGSAASLSYLINVSQICNCDLDWLLDGIRENANLQEKIEYFFLQFREHFQSDLKFLQDRIEIAVYREIEKLKEKGRIF
jgi:transcriptional regulator with XRE-family HTH domain